MKWNLEVDIALSNSFQKINYKNGLIAIGSCFTEHIGMKLKHRKFPISVNPFGVMYNPVSIRNALNRILNNQSYQHEDLRSFNDLYLLLDCDTSFSGPEKDTVLEKINTTIENAHARLQPSSTIVVSFGTAFYYILKSAELTEGYKNAVGNCHKMPVSEFDRSRLQSDEITALYSDLMQACKDAHLSLQWIFTISPVRHWKDGAADNQWSKSILTCAVRELVSSFDNAHYFPSYEIMMDELRDHRFYNEDLIHPNQQAVNYIWEKFANHCIANDDLHKMAELEKILDRLSHRPLNPDSKQHMNFEAETEQLIERFQSDHPEVNFD